MYLITVLVVVTAYFGIEICLIADIIHVTSLLNEAVVASAQESVTEASTNLGEQTRDTEALTTSTIEAYSIVRTPPTT